MDPGNDAFLAAYLERLELDDFDAAFGGYETDEPDDRRYQLHAVLARTSAQKDAAARSQTTESLLQKFRDGAVNYARLLKKHPHLAGLPGARVARTLGAIPGQGLLRGLWAALANSQAAPVRLRAAALKLWRASWAAEAI